MWPRVAGLRAFAFGSPGEMRERLTALVLTGTKTATAGLFVRDYQNEDEALETIGERQVVLGSTETPVAVVEITRLECHAFAKVPWEFANAEGEGFTSIAHWQQAHLDHWTSQMLEISDDTIVVCVWFKLVATEIFGNFGTKSNQPIV